MASKDHQALCCKILQSFCGVRYVTKIRGVSEHRYRKLILGDTLVFRDANIKPRGTASVWQCIQKMSGIIAGRLRHHGVFAVIGGPLMSR